MNKVMSVCMDNFPNFQWKINVHDADCYESTVSGSFGPYNSIDIFSNGAEHTIVSEFAGEGKWDQDCTDIELGGALNDLAIAWGHEQQKWFDIVNGKAPYED